MENPLDAILFFLLNWCPNSNLLVWIFVSTAHESYVFSFIFLASCVDICQSKLVDFYVSNLTIIE